jgi:transposase
MSHSQAFDPIIPPTEKPHCSRCGALMGLASVEPGKPDHDQRTFKCPECEHSETFDVKFR